MLTAPAKGDPCDEPPGKPKALAVPQPAYTDAARAAGISGRVRVEITVDERGHVARVRVLEGLGYGLDEAALASARAATFDPAMRCGKPVSATFTVAMRFTL
ncbi:MAG: energy transducer TonB [Polyangiaceae bacterium]|nr:energy transducer TonB [Polyangiaceae bacterium]